MSGDLCGEGNVNCGLCTEGMLCILSGLPLCGCKLLWVQGLFHLVTLGLEPLILLWGL